MKAKHPRFEVEDLTERTNYTFALEEGCVSLYNTSRGKGNRHMETWGPEKFPVGDTAEEYYDFLYEKALKVVPGGICFLGYVDENFQPIEETNPDG